MPVDRVLRVEFDNVRRCVRIVEQNRRGACFNAGSDNDLFMFTASNGFWLASISVPEIVPGGHGMYVRGTVRDRDCAYLYLSGRVIWEDFKAKLSVALEEYNTEGGAVLQEAPNAE